jgi:hypothetical protein
MLLELYCEEILACVFRQFEKRGFTFKQTMPLGYSSGVVNGQVTANSEIHFRWKEGRRV